jgi:hypothetical protein
MIKKLAILLTLVFCINFILASGIDPGYVKSSIVLGQEKSVSLDVSCDDECQLDSYGDFFDLSSSSGGGEFMTDVVFESMDEGVYVGSVVLDGDVIPVILEISSEKLDFAVTLDVSSADKGVSRFDTVFPKINLYNLKQSAMDAKVSSYVYDLRGNILYSDLESFSIEDKHSYVKSIILDESFLIEGYVFAVEVESESGVVVSSYSFDVVKERNSLFDSGSSLFIVIVIVILILILGIVFYILYERRVFFRDIERKHKEELRFYTNKIKEEEVASLARVKTAEEKIKVQKEFSDAKSKILYEMKREHRKQKKEMKKIKLEKKNLSKKDMAKFNKGVYNKALKSSAIGVDLKNKLSTLKYAYDEGIITKSSLSKGKERISKAHNKLKRNVYK